MVISYSAINYIHSSSSASILDSSEILASSSTFSRKYSSSSDCHLASRARRNSSSNFRCVRLCPSAFSLAYSEVLSSYSAFKHACSFVSYSSLASSSLNPPPPPSTLLQGRGGPLLLPSVAHSHSPLLPDLRLQQGVPHLLNSNVPATLSHISALPLQQGRPCLQTSAVNPPSPIISG